MIPRIAALGIAVLSSWVFAAEPAPPATQPARPPQTQTQPASAPSVPAALSAEQLFAKVSPAVARLEVKVNGGAKLGSGFFVSKDGMLVTNYHVVEGGLTVTVVMGEKTKLAVKGILAADAVADLVILQVEAKDMPIAELAGPALPAVGEKVYAIGNPEGMTNTLSEGLVSGVRKDEGNESRKEVIQTSAAISPGSRGGPLLRANGTVIGVTFAGMVQGQNLNFAIPAQYVADLIKKAKGKPVLIAVTDLPMRDKPLVREPSGPGRHPGLRPGRPSRHDVPGALADLAGGNKNLQVIAASWLERAEITDKADVAKIHDALAALLDAEDASLRTAIVKAFGRYALAKDSAALAKVARDDKEYWTCYGPAMRALMEVDAKVARSIFEERCDDFSFESWAAGGLMELSSSSEKDIWPLLESKKGKVCAEACRILGKIGSAKSIPVLKDVTGKHLHLEDRISLLRAADEALKDLLSRNPKSPGGN